VASREDYLFERDIIEEEDYARFWDIYWHEDDEGREDLIEEYRAAALEEDAEISVFPVVIDESEARKQAQAAEDLTGDTYIVVRRNALGQFSVGGHSWQAIRHR